MVQFVKAKSYLNDRFFQARFLDMEGLQDENHFIGIQLHFNHVLLAYSVVKVSCQTFINNYLSFSHILLMLGLLKLKFMNFLSKWERCKNVVSTGNFYSFRSYLVVYSDTKKLSLPLPLDSQKSKFCCCVAKGGKIILSDNF